MRTSKAGFKSNPFNAKVHAVNHYDLCKDISLLSHGVAEGALGRLPYSNYFPMSTAALSPSR